MDDGVPTDHLSHKHCDCNNHTVTSCVFVLLVPTVITRRRRRAPSTTSASPSSPTWTSLVSSVTTHLPKGEQLRTGKTDVYQQPIAGLSPKSSWVKEYLPGRGGNVFVSVLHSHDKTSRLCVETRRCWTLAEDLLSEWEERKKRRAGGGALCKSRKTIIAAAIRWSGRTRSRTGAGKVRLVNLSRLSSFVPLL